MEQNTKAMELQQEIINLQTSLGSNTSAIGDYKIMKIYEARLKGAPDPYDASELIAKRDAVRKEINEKQAQLAALENDGTV